MENNKQNPLAKINDWVNKTNEWANKNKLIAFLIALLITLFIALSCYYIGLGIGKILRYYYPPCDL